MLSCLNLADFLAVFVLFSCLNLDWLMATVANCLVAEKSHVIILEFGRTDHLRSELRTERTFIDFCASESY